MNEPNNGLPGRYSNNPGQINRLVKLEPIRQDKTAATETEESAEAPEPSSDEHPQAE